MLAAFVGVIFAVVPILIQQATNLIQNFPDIIQDISQQDWFQDLSKQFSGSFDIDHALQSVQSFVEDPGNLLNLGGGILAVGGGILSGLTGALIVLILMLYFLASMRGLKSMTYRFVPASRRENFVDVSEQITQAVGRYVVGQISQALINGVLSLVFLLIIGAPLPVLLASFAFLGSLIPLVGTLSAAVVISLLCLFASPATALTARCTTSCTCRSRRTSSPRASCRVRCRCPAPSWSSPRSRAAPSAVCSAHSSRCRSPRR